MPSAYSGFLQHGACLVGAIFALGIAAAAPASAQTADLVFVNGKVFTADERSSLAEAFAVKDGRFIAVKRLAMVDLSGATVENGYNPIQSKVLRKPSLIEEIKKAGERAASLTRQLLMFSRRQVLEPRIIDLNDLLAGMEPMLGRLVGGLRQSLRP